MPGGGADPTNTVRVADPACAGFLNHRNIAPRPDWIQWQEFTWNSGWSDRTRARVWAGG